jgi:protein gp37
MGAKTGIEWTDSTWNPFMGCSRVSEGCRHCYAERFARRLESKPNYAGLTQIVNGAAVWSGDLKEGSGDTWDAPFHWKKPRNIFVNSMSDLFHPKARLAGWISRVLAVVALAPRHRFQVLTKRPELMLEFFQQFYSAEEWAESLSTLRDEDDIPLFGENAECAIANAINGVLGDGHNVGWPMRNLWLGVSDEGNQHQRLDLLQQTPAAKRFVSFEPLIFDLGKVNLEHIDWVICGGESGPGARPMHTDWARSLRDQCVAAGVPFFFKQWGEWCDWDQLPEDTAQRLDANGETPTEGLLRVGKKAAEALLDGREWKEFPKTAASC